MSRSLRFSAVPAILTAALTACGGGGGGGGGSGASAIGGEVPFTSFNAVRPNQTLVMSGISQTGSGTDSAFNLDPVGAAEVKLGFDSGRNLADMSLSTPQASLAFGRDETSCSTFGACVGAKGDAFAILMNPLDLGWNYQSFGLWMNNMSPTTFQAGAISVGAATPASAVPTTSSATFTGHAGGFYFNGAGGQFGTDAQMTAIANFQTRQIDLRMTGTLLTDRSKPFDDQGRPLAVHTPGLDLSGTLNYAAGVNQFSGDVKTQNQELSGTASGRFYGPSAQEIGGVYGLGSATGARMVGGFGGKR